MKLLWRGKDGGPESTVTGYWLIEAKGLVSVALLRFEDGSRDAFHNHAFHAISWLLKGELEELFYNRGTLEPKWYRPSLKPIITKRDTFHQVRSKGRSWAITFRGPWHKTWREYLPNQGRERTLTNHRVVVG